MRHTDPQFASFDITKSDEIGIGLFDEYVWNNRELCNHCFTRIREVSPNLTHASLSISSLRNVPQFHDQKTRNAQTHRTPWPELENRRYGKTFCETCSSDTTAGHRDLPLKYWHDIIPRLYAYVDEHSPIELDAEAFATAFVKLKKTPAHQGRETQMLALSFARAIQNDPPKNRYYWAVRQVSEPA